MGYLGNTPENQAFTPRVDYFSGNASATSFTLSFPVASVAQVQAVIENVPQNPGDAYTVSGNTITFTSAPPSGTNNIYVYYTSPITQVVTPGQGTVNTLQLVDGAVTQDKLAAGAGSQWVTSGANISYTTGNVGIGTSSPSVPLAVYKASDSAINIQNSASGLTNIDGLQLLLSGSNGYMWNYENGANIFGTNNTERMRLTSGGELGIGTTSPAAQLQINRSGTGDYTTMRLSNSGASGRTYEIGVAGNTADSTYANKLYFYDGTASAPRMAINSSGDLQFNSGYGSMATAYGCRAWVNFNGTGTVAIRASGNVSSITDNGTGDYTVNFSTAMPDANYSVGAQGARTDSTTTNSYYAFLDARTTISEIINTAYCRIFTGSAHASGAGGVRYDAGIVTVQVFR